MTLRYVAPRVAVAVAPLLLLAACTGSSTSSKSSAAGTSTSSSTSAAPSTGASSSAAPALQSDYVQTIKAVLPSVVLIQTSKDLGSGVVFDNKGDIVTNDHVVGSATSFQVTPSGSVKSRAAKIVGTDPTNDLAVIRVSDTAGLKPARFGDSDKAAVGDIVLAVGNPLGLASSVTNGIISAVGRTVSEPTGPDSPGATLPDVIQTSASINPGNSGGALVDLQDEVIGIPTLVATSQQGGGQAPGIGFAISSNTVKDIAGQLVAHGKVINSHRAALGVRVATLTGPDGQPGGVGILDVQAGGGAAEAGLKPGEIVVAVDGEPTPTTQALSTVLAGLKPGQQVTVKIQTQQGSTKDVKVTLGHLP